MTEYRKQYAVDICIRGWQNARLTFALLNSIVANTPNVPYQLIYVDNGSGPGGPVFEDGDYPDFTCVALPFNHGSVRAINIGLAMAQFSDAPYILLMDNDTQVPSGDTTWLERFIGYFADPKVGAAGATSNYVSGYQHICRLPERAIDQPPFASPLLVSFAMMLRKDAVRACGYLDERYEPGNCEDFDYTLTLADYGWTAVVADSVYIEHKGSQTFKSLDFGKLLATNNAKLVKKWGREKLQQLGVTVQEAAG